ncbi:hypothetical protein L6452_37240 [Arctium lappa]|uniref:Uncharacterized protein n=1 Tax=Arctium lappa TaxID=4217 RepID=A0ACB8Y1T5_ARCLA|nr:hypothetical protein L6452_37240 [Arctium lappa]
MPISTMDSISMVKFEKGHGSSQSFSMPLDVRARILNIGKFSFYAYYNIKCQRVYVAKLYADFMPFNLVCDGWYLVAAKARMVMTSCVGAVVYDTSFIEWVARTAWDKCRASGRQFDSRNHGRSLGSI